MQVNTRRALVAGLFLTVSACGGGGGASSTGAGTAAIGGNSSSSTPAAGQAVEFHGTVDAVVAPSFTVGARSVTTDASTKFFKDDATAAFDAITVGTSVEVLGTVQSDGSVLATKVEISSSSSGDSHDDSGEHDSHPTDTIIFKAALQSVSEDGKTLKVGDLTVTVADTTKLVKGESTVTVADLIVGDVLVVRGVLQPGPTVAASKIRVVVPGSHDESDDDDSDDDDDDSDSSDSSGH